MSVTTVLPFPVFRALDTNGLPLVGGKLYTYQAGSSTPQATYTDSTGVTPNANPVVLDSTGSANVWLGNLPYKLVLKDSLGNTLWTVDGLQNGLTVNYAATAFTDSGNHTLTNPLSTVISGTFTTTGKKLILPASNATNSLPLGVPVLVVNPGSNAFTITAADGTTSIVAVPPGGAAIIALQDNSTSNGTWSATAVPTAGTYLQKDANGNLTLNLGHNMGADNSGKLVWELPSNIPTGTTLTLTDALRGAYVDSESAGGTLTVTLPDATAVGDGCPYFFFRKTNNIVINTVSAQVIDLPGNMAVTAYTLNFQGAFLGLVSNNGAWRPVGGRPDIAAPGTAGNILTDNGTAWQSAAPPATLVTAFVCFTPGVSPVIKNSLNVASVVRNGAGDYTVNFTSAYADTNYVPIPSQQQWTDDGTNATFCTLRSKLVGSVTIVNVFQGHQQDPQEVNLVVFGT